MNDMNKKLLKTITDFFKLSFPGSQISPLENSTQLCRISNPNYDFYRKKKELEDEISKINFTQREDLRPRQYQLVAETIDTHTITIKLIPNLMNAKAVLCPSEAYAYRQDSPEITHVGEYKIKMTNGELLDHEVFDTEEEAEEFIQRHSF